MSILLVGTGGAIGSCLRYLLGVCGHALLGSGMSVLPTATANLTGSALIGVFSAVAEARGISEASRLLVQTGILGGFTTFSAFSLEAVSLWQSERWWASLIYALVSIAGSLLAFAGGHALTREYL